MKPPRPRILVAPDSFKGTMSAAEVAGAIVAGVVAAGAEADICPLADGGEGTAAAFLAARGGEERQARVHDPLGREVEAAFVDLGDGEAVLDGAAASGLALLDPAELDAEAASSAGTGELIGAAIGAGARTVLVAAGGSATTDGGRGAVEALRSAGGIGGARLVVLCDVQTAFEDAARVFGPQKGADAGAVARLSARLDAYAQALPRDPRGLPMTGCAGGLGGGLWAAFDAELVPGAARVFDLLDLDRRLAAADLVISGEGRLDSQSFEGKVVGELARRCASAETPLEVLVGKDARDPLGREEPAIRDVTEAGDPAALAAAAERIATSASASAS